MTTLENPLVVSAVTARDVESAEALPQAITAKVRYSQGFCAAIQQGLSVKYHIRIFVLNAVVLACGLGLLGIYVLGYQESESHYSMRIAFTVVGGVFYFFYLIDCCISDTLAYLGNRKDYVNADEYVRRVRAARPSMTEEAHCYHYETRTRQVAYTEYIVEHIYRNGQYETKSTPITKYRTETYRELVTTHRDTLHIKYTHVTDTSIVPDLSFYSICKVKCSKQWKPTEATQSLYHDIEQQFQNKHRYCDEERTFSSTLTLPGYKDKVLTYISEDDIPFVIRHGRIMFCLCTLLPINWIFRVYVSGICGEMDIAFKKVVEVVNN